LWILGQHRLLCGDSTVAPYVELVLGGVKPHLMVTDPPYGVDYDPAWRTDAGLKQNKQRLGKVANDDRADWRGAWALFPGSVAYVWHAGRYASTVQDSLAAAGFEVRSQIIWAKDRFALSRGHYHWQHEPCWYAVRQGPANWSGDRKQSTLWSISSGNQDAETSHGTRLAGNQLAIDPGGARRLDLRVDIEIGPHRQRDTAPALGIVELA